MATKMRHVLSLCWGWQCIMLPKILSFPKNVLCFLLILVYITSFCPPEMHSYFFFFSILVSGTKKAKTALKAVSCPMAVCLLCRHLLTPQNLFPNLCRGHFFLTTHKCLRSTDLMLQLLFSAFHFAAFLIRISRLSYYPVPSLFLELLIS